LLNKTAGTAGERPDCSSRHDPSLAWSEFEIHPTAGRNGIIAPNTHITRVTALWRFRATWLKEGVTKAIGRVR